jgi:hypothetical protein
MGPDVFISYSHSDDRAPLGRPGIVSRIKEYLTIAAPHKYGRELHFFSDKDLEPGVRWSPELKDKIAACRIFMPVISPSWKGSKFCQFEWTQCQQLVNGEDLAENRTRILPISFELPEGSELELAPDQAGLQIKHRFCDAMTDAQFEQVANDLANSLTKMLRFLDSAAPPTPAASKNARRVFLGFAFSKKMAAWRDRIKTELAQRKWEVAEFKYDFAHSPAEVAEGIRNSLAGCAAAVHFFSDDFGPFPWGPKERPLLKLQCEISNELARQGLAEFFWAGPDLELDGIQDSDYRHFLTIFGPTNETVQKFLNSLLERLKALQQPRDPKPPPGLIPIICLICESGDRDVCSEIKQYLERDKHWVVTMPNLDVAQGRVSDSYARVFRDNEFFLFYWGNGSEDWCTNNVEALVDARRSERGFLRNPRAAAIYFALEKYPYKEKFGWPWTEIRQYDRFDKTAERFQQFVRDVEALVNTRTGATAQEDGK